MDYKRVTENYIEKLIVSNKITKAPVIFEDIVGDYPITIRKYNLNDEVSGILVIDENGNATIGFNPKESPYRIRFSIAHELGHYFLHSNNSKGIFMDKLMFRKNIKLYNRREEQVEIEANYFAANLLMPKQILINEINQLDYLDDDEDNIKKLADKFQVSVSAMTFRLINLGLYCKF